MTYYRHDAALTRRAYQAERSLPEPLERRLLAGPITDTDTEALDALRGEISRIVRAIIGSAWWNDAHGPSRVEAHVSRSRQRSSGGWSGLAYMAGFDRGATRRWNVRFGRTPFLSSRMTIAHELAHVLHIAATETRRQPAGFDPYGHGPSWAGAFVRLAVLICGPEPAAALDLALHRHGLVPHTAWLPPAPAQIVADAPQIHPTPTRPSSVDDQLALAI